ncbi:ABC transporter permease [Corynebacterium testudinoris]|uniref:FtsX-like permease family n=1 Tax=Corynebacterium testudinoris TaxID=136857 RepID=A0A0G3H472_9CORY|nr:FtsX-like permease family protein [Corynebacterium testudinoris]AKK08184.1 FtsX-like permease family [Corynebacterium testudinoris]
MSTLLAATRPTRRDMVKHPWRLFAAMLLVALPVFLIVSLATYESSSNNVLRATEVHSTTWKGGGASCVQTVSGSNSECTGTASTGNEREELERALPSGFRTELSVLLPGELRADNNRTVYSSIQQLPAESLPHNLQPRTGTLPASGEIMISPSIADQLQVSVGDSITFTSPDHEGASGPLRISGTMPGAWPLTIQPTLFSPESVSTEFEGFGSGISWVISGDRKFTWEDVQALNAAGFVVNSLDVKANPPTEEELDPAMRGLEPIYPDQSLNFFLSIMVPSIMLVGMLILLIISPVFTIAVSRQTKVFALMSSQGATPRQIRWAVLAYGLGAGLVGATLGAAIGLATATGWWMYRYPGWPMNVPWQIVGAAWVTAVIGSVVAAFLPAVLASRASISAGIAGAAPDRMMRWRPWMAVGPVVLVLTLAFLGVMREFIPDWYMFYESFGRLVVIAALAASAPALGWLIARLGRTAPLTLRLAVRDAGRQMMKTAPALAAIMAISFVAVSVWTSAETSNNRQLTETAEVYQYDTATIMSSGYLPQELKKEELQSTLDSVKAITGPAKEVDLYGMPMTLVTGDPHPTLSIKYPDCRWPEELESEKCSALTNSGWVGGPFRAGMASTVFGGPDLLEMFALDDSVRQEASTALLRGVVLIPTSQAILVEEDGTATFELLTGDIAEPIQLPAMAVLPAGGGATIIPREVAGQLGLHYEYVGTTLMPLNKLTYEQRTEISDSLKESAIGLNATFTPTFGVSWKYTAPLLAGILALIVVVVVALVLALSMQTSRRHFALIDALGASPSLPSRATALFAGGLTLAGTLTGSVIGLLFTWLTLQADYHNYFSGEIERLGDVQFFQINWYPIIALVVVAPLLAAGVGSLFHRRRAELEYRET